MATNKKCRQCGSKRMAYVSVRAPSEDWTFTTEDNKAGFELPIIEDDDVPEDENESRMDVIEETFGSFGVRGDMMTDCIELNLKVCRDCRCVR